MTCAHVKSGGAIVTRGSVAAISAGAALICVAATVTRVVTNVTRSSAAHISVAVTLISNDAALMFEVPPCQSSRRGVQNQDKRLRG